MVVFLAAKFVHGAFIVAIVVPCLVILFLRINRYYQSLDRALGINEKPPSPSPKGPGIVFVPVVGISKLTALVMEHALAMGGEVRALHVAFAGEPTEELEKDWKKWAGDIPMIILPSPERSVVRAFLDYLNQPEIKELTNITVLIGEIEPRLLRHRLLLNQRGTLLATVLRRRTDAVVATVAFRLK